MKHFWLFLSVVIFANAAKSVINYSLARPHEAVVEHISLDLVIDFQRKVVKGSATLSIKRIVGDQLFLDSEGLIIHEISGTGLEWEPIVQDNGADKIEGIKIILDTHVADDEHSITIVYESSPNARGLVWVDKEQTRMKEPMLFSHNYPIGARTWIPCQDTPAVSQGIFMKVRIEKEDMSTPYLVLVSGSHNYRQARSDMFYDNLMSDKNIPLYQFALVAGNFRHHEIAPQLGFYTESNWFSPHEKDFKKELISYYDYLSDTFYPKLWFPTDLVLLASGFPLDYGVHPRLVLVNEVRVYDARHELARSLAKLWALDFMHFNNWSDSRLWPALSEYFYYRSLKKVRGWVFAQGMSFFEHLNIETAATLEENAPCANRKEGLNKNPPDDVHPDRLVDNSWAARGSLIFLALEDRIGLRPLDQALETIIKTKSSLGKNELINLGRTALSATGDMTFNKWDLTLSSWFEDVGEGPLYFEEKFKGRCIGCIEKYNEFKQYGLETDYSKWTYQQIIFLLRESIELADKYRILDSDIVNETFLARPDLDDYIYSLRYQLVIRTGLWQHYKQELSEYLSLVYEPRFILPLYALLCETPEAKIFAQEIFHNYQMLYFPTVREAIQETLLPVAAEKALFLSH